MSPEESAEILTAILLFALDGLRLILVAFVIWLLVPRHRQCPQCGEPTSLLETSKALRWILLEKRWCLACGWSGLARMLPRTPSPGSESRTEAPARPGPAP